MARGGDVISPALTIFHPTRAFTALRDRPFKNRLFPSSTIPRDFAPPFQRAHRCRSARASDSRRHPCWKIDDHRPPCYYWPFLCPWPLPVTFSSGTRPPLRLCLTQNMHANNKRLQAILSVVETHNNERSSAILRIEFSIFICVIDYWPRPNWFPLNFVFRKMWYG